MKWIVSVTDHPFEQVADPIEIEADTREEAKLKGWEHGYVLDVQTEEEYEEEFGK